MANAASTKVPEPVSELVPLTPIRMVSSPTDMSRRGSIRLITGPMFSGKSRELKRRLDVRRISSTKQAARCLLIVPKGDTRYSKTAILVTHNRIVDADCVALDEHELHLAPVANICLLYT